MTDSSPISAQLCLDKMAMLQTSFSHACHERKLSNVDSNFAQVRSYGSCWEQVNIGSDYGLVANRQQAITWINVDHDLWRHMVSLDLNELADIHHLQATREAAISLSYVTRFISHFKYIKENLTALLNVFRNYSNHCNGKYTAGF